MTETRATVLSSFEHAAATDAGASTARARFSIAVDQAKFSTNRISSIRHDFHNHPLMQLPELACAAKELYPTQQCRFIRPDCKESSPFDHDPTTQDGSDIDEVFQRIEEPGSWIALYNVETLPRYRQFLDDVIASVRPQVEKEQTGIHSVGGFIFISAPPSVTPFHIDRENNFWLQVAGRKTIRVWDHTDEEIVPPLVKERFILDCNLRDVVLKDEYARRSHDFEVGPGDGVYFPSTSPHLTKCDAGVPGGSVSISIGVVFYTNQTRRDGRIHAANRLLRSYGLEPRQPGKGGWSEPIKVALGVAHNGARAAYWFARKKLLRL